MILLLYWGLWILISTVGVSDGSNPLIASNLTYGTHVEINASGFTGDEIDETGFFSTLAGIVVAMGRFFGFALFGFTPALSGLSQLLVTMWASCWTMLTIGWIIDAFWSG